MKYVIPAMKSLTTSLLRLKKIGKLIQKRQQLTTKQLTTALKLVYFKENFRKNNQKTQTAFSNRGNSLQLRLQEFQDIYLQHFPTVEQKP